MHVLRPVHEDVSSRLVTHPSSVPSLSKIRQAMTFTLPPTLLREDGSRGGSSSQRCQFAPLP